jgi:hypothetical protein
MMFKFRTALLSLALLAPLAPLAQAAAPVLLYKSQSCGCCEEYVKYLKANGYDVNAINSGVTRRPARSDGQWLDCVLGER